MSYGTDPASVAYHDAHGNTAWGLGTETARNVARLRGSEYIDRTFYSSFPGRRTEDRDQVREWPRESTTSSPVVDREWNTIESTETPIEVEESSYEAAFLEFITPDTLTPVYDPANQRRSVQVGDIEVEFTAGHGFESVRKMITIVIGIIAPVLTGSSNSSRIVGKSERF